MNQCSSATSRARGAGPWVIVVEEDPVVRCLIASVLRDAAYCVQTSLGERRADGLASDAPGLMVLGMLPPEQQARAMAMHPGVPVLALSETAALTADAYLPAPFAAADLLDAVRVLLVLAAARDAEPSDTRVDVGAVLEVALRLASHALHTRAQVTCEFDTQLRVRANPEQLCLVFLHLLTTAASRIEEGHAGANGIRVAGWRTAEGRTVVEISDTGAAIPAARLASLRGAGAGDEDDGGPGLDFRASQRLVTAGGGAITVSSHAGGTRFRVELPTA